MKYLTFLFIICLVSCSTKKTIGIANFATPLSSDAPVEVLGLGQKLPENVKLIGQIKIGDSGFTTNCGYDKVLKDAISQARSLGGNILQITEHKEPSILGSSCHRIKADVYLKK